MSRAGNIKTRVASRKCRVASKKNIVIYSRICLPALNTHW